MSLKNSAVNNEKTIYVFLKVDHSLIGRIDFKLKQKKDKNHHYIFTYLSDDVLVSLSAHENDKGQLLYNGRLPPFFETSLIEGFKKTALKKQCDTKLSRNKAHLLTFSGLNNVGAFAFSFDDKIIENPQLKDLPDYQQFKKSGLGLFNEFFLKFNQQTGIGGVQPKSFAATSSKNRQENMCDKRYIVKAETKKFKYLSLIEFLSMSAAKYSGIKTPDFELSDDQRLFIIKRFDITESNKLLNIEESSALNDLNNNEKYQGHYAQFADNIKNFSNNASDLGTYFKTIVLNNLIENGDAHHKNFALLYDPKNVTQAEMSPAYDIVCTTVFIKNDTPALALSPENYTKKWVDVEALMVFGMNHCDLSKTQVKTQIKQVINGIEQVIKMVSDYYQPENQVILHDFKKILLNNITKAKKHLTA